MPILTPTEAVNAANAIYGILDTSTNYRNTFISSIRENFDLFNSTNFRSKSGFTFWQVESGFGMAAMGQGKLFDKHALITVRGTSKGIDWITDAHAGISFVNGKMVHSGFNKVFHSFEEKLGEFFKHNKPTHVHCVGHSLGGAVATLVADWVKTANMGTIPYLYTFGSPRVGSEAFARSLTQRVGASNIYRVFHGCDPVPMVPIWPFVHAPLPGNQYGLDYSRSKILFWRAHYIDNYANAVGGIQEWEKLNIPVSNTASDKDVENWLASTVKILRLTSPVLFMIQDALMYILKKVLYLTGIGLQGVVMGVSTTLDLIAMALHKGVQVSKEIAGYVKSLMQKILSAVGIMVNVAKDITMEFIRWVLTKLAENLYAMYKQAVSSTIV